MTYAAIAQHARLLRAAVRRGDLHGAAARRRSRSTKRSVRQPVLRRQPRSTPPAYVVAPVTYLMGNDFERVDVDALELTIKSAEEPKTATLERVWLDDPRPRAGRTVPLKVRCAPTAARRSSGRCRSRFPANASGTLSMLVADGARLGQTEQRETRLAAAAQRRADDPVAQQGAPQQHALRASCSARMPARSSTASCCRRCRRRCSACSKAIATAAASTRSTARRSANGSCRPSTPSAGSRTLTSPSRRADFATSMQSVVRDSGGGSSLAAPRAASRCRPPPRSSSGPRRRPTSSRATSRTSRRQPGTADLGPATELVYETSAPFLWSMPAGIRRDAVRRHR